MTAARALVVLTGRLFPGSTSFLGWGTAFTWGCSVSGSFTAKHIQMCFSLPLVVLEVRSLEGWPHFKPKIGSLILQYTLQSKVGFVTPASVQGVEVSKPKSER